MPLRSAVVLSLLLAATAACADSEPMPEDSAAGTPSAEGGVVEVRATDYAFTAPDTVPAGMVRLRMVAEGAAFHHVQVVRLEDGHTFEEFAAAAAQSEGGPPPPWVRLLGGANGADPGAAAETSVHLVPGQYAFICSIPTPDGVPHLAMGMMRPFTVVGAASEPTAPETDATITMTADGFTLSGPIAAGERNLLVRNEHGMPHEAIIVRLADGATAASLLEWLLAGMEGPPPGSGQGGTVALEQGAWNVVHATFEPGNYAVVDFIPNPADGRPNAAHGMLLDFTVE